MPDNIQRTRGRGQGYRFDRGGTPTEFGPFVGEVKNNVDSTRSGRLQVFIEQFAGDNPDDKSLWRTVSYIPPFYGSVQQSGTDTGDGTFVGNPQSYGMWFTPPDIGTLVICFFVEGDPNQGYYLGCIPDPGINHMIPAVGASKNFTLDNNNQQGYFSDSKQLPVTEINNENDAISENPKFFDQKKPVHSVVAGIMMEQGIINDIARGPITSSSQRESPSNVYGVSTPGRPVYQGGLSEDDVKEKLNSGAKLDDVKIIGRRGGHSLVMDDGNLEGIDNLVRLRTSKGHQITMSDTGDFFYIIHANGQTWVELGTSGTIDLFSTNSVNVRSQGQINLHADKSINMYAGESINIKSKNVRINSSENLDIAATSKLTLYSKSDIGVRADGSLTIKNSGAGGWDGGDSLVLKAGTIDLNGPSPGTVGKPTLLTDTELPDTTFVTDKGWQEEKGKLKTIVTRAPTHEPYSGHGSGVTEEVQTSAAETSVLGSVSEPAPNVPVNQTTEQLANEPVTTPVNTAQILKQPEALRSIGSLATPQVTGLMASTAAIVAQPFNQFSVTKGIGMYGFNPAQLEASGYIKPGTISRYSIGGVNANNIAGILASPLIWTGKNNIPNLNTLLRSQQMQSLIQQDLLSQGLRQLRTKGVIKGSETTSQVGALLQNAARFGPDATVSWVKGQVSGKLVSQMNSFAKNAQQAVSKATGGIFNIGNLQLALYGTIAAFSRQSVDAAVKSIINNPKVPAPKFVNGYASASTSASASSAGTNATPDPEPASVRVFSADQLNRNLSE